MPSFGVSVVESAIALRLWGLGSFSLFEKIVQFVKVHVSFGWIVCSWLGVAMGQVRGEERLQVVVVYDTWVPDNALKPGVRGVRA